MKTKVRAFQRNFAAMRARADAGEPVEILAAGKPRYVFKLIHLPAPESLFSLCRRATKGLKLERDKAPLRKL